MHSPEQKKASAAEGARRCDRGMKKAAHNHEWEILRGRLAFLDAIRSAPNRTATTDDATSDIGRAYPDGGRWRGTITKGLASLRLIRKVGVVASVRASRHGGYIAVWQGIDDDCLDAHRDDLRRQLAEMTPPIV